MKIMSEEHVTRMSSLGEQDSCADVACFKPGHIMLIVVGRDEIFSSPPLDAA